MRVTSLTVHRNTMDKRRCRENAARLKGCAERERQLGDMEGFALVTWNKERGYSCDLHLPERSPVTMCEVQAFVGGAVSREIAKIDRER